jgi:hypothetical protein
MRGRRAAWLAVLWTSASSALLACGAAFTAGEATGDGGLDAPGESASNDAPPGLDGPEGSDGTRPDVTGNDGPSTKDGSGGEASSGDAVSEGVLVEVGTFDAPGDVVVGHKTVFITSTLSTGDLGGLSGADATCQSLANAAGLGGTYKAWLSSTTTSAASRLTHSTGPYVLINGVPVASSWVALTTPPLLNPIDVTETGGPPAALASACGVTNASVAWTSTNPNGSVGTTLGATCAEWTTSGASLGAVLGFADRTDGSWTAGCSAQGAGSTICGMQAALYCFEQ